MPARLDIALQRNEDWSRTLRITADGKPIDLTGMRAALEVRSKLDQALVTRGEIDFTDPQVGEMTATLRGSRGPLSTYGAQIQVANLHYDLRLTDTDGFQTILFGGLVILSRGETRA